MANRKVTYEVGFTADTSQLQNALKQASLSLQAIGKNPLYLKQGLEDAANAALELNNHLLNAYSADTGKLDLTKFRLELDKSGETLDHYANLLSALGPEGLQAFLQVAGAITAAELPLKRSNQLLNLLWVTMKNTARWRLTTGALNAFIGGLLSAFGYAKSLDASINNIRIVTSKSADEMARFAKEANKAALELNTTTTTYTDASLIYYQQGLDDEAVKERTDATIKMANVTGQSAETISSLMTAIWNNFADGSKALETYADGMVALGATTATSSKEIAEGLEKFAPVANTVGLSFEYASAALATITATTRESASVAGNALKTLFSRLEGLKLGETLDDGTDLNKYSNALMTVGVNIKDVNGELKDMDTILADLGSRWSSLARDELMALAETVGGVRQYAQLVALMDNWTFFQQNLATVQGSEGSLQKLADIYAESWEAARDRVKAATENVYDSLINPLVFIDLDKIASATLKPLAAIIDGFGGLTGILPIVAALLTKVYSSQIAKSMSDMAVNIGLMTGKELERVRILLAEWVALTKKIGLDYDDASSMSTKTEIMKREVELLGQINANIDSYSDFLKQLIENTLRLVSVLKLEAIAADEARENLQELFNDAAGYLKEGLIGSKNNYYTRLKSIFNTKELSNEAQKSVQIITDTFSKIKKATEFYKELGSNKRSVIENLFAGIEDAAAKSANILSLRTELNNTSNETKILSARALELALSLGMVKGEAETDELYFQRLKESVSAGGDAASQAQTDFVGLSEILKAFGGELFLKEINEYLSLVKQLGPTSEKAQLALDRLYKTMEAGKNPPENLITWSDVFVDIANAASRATMMIRAFENLGEVFEDLDLEPAEKFTRVLTSLGMLLPTIIPLIKTFGHTATTAGAEVGAGAAAAGTGIAAGAAAILAAVPYITLIVGGIYLLIKAFDWLTISSEEATKAINDSLDEYKEAKTELLNLQEELKTTLDRIKELLDIANSGSISIVELEELNKLQIQNDKLERLIKLQEKLAALKFKDSLNEFLKNGAIAYALTDKPQEGISEANWGDLAELLRNVTVFNEDYKDIILSQIGAALTEDDIILTREALKAQVENELLVPNRFKNSFLKDIDIIYDAIDNYNIEMHDKWTAENLETLSNLEDFYIQTVDNVENISEESFEAVRQTLELTRKALYDQEGEYVKTFVDPILSLLSEQDINNILNDQSLTDLGKKIVQSSGVSINDLQELYAAISATALEQLSKFGINKDSDLFKSLGFAELKLVADNNFENFASFWNYLKDHNGIIPISILVEDADNTRLEALEAMASGEFLSDELIEKIKEAYVGIADLSDFENWPVVDLINLLDLSLEKLTEDEEERVKLLKALRTNILRQQYEAIAERDYQKRTELNNIKIALDIEIDEAEKQIEKLRERIEKDPWLIDINADNALAATLNNAKAAFKLINDDLTVNADNLVELAKRYPEALVDSTYDSVNNILSIEKEKYEALQGYINDTLDNDRDAAVQKLQDYANTAAGIISMALTVADSQNEANKDTAEKAVTYNAETLASIKQTALEGLIEVVKSEISRRELYVESKLTQESTSAAATTTISENANIITKNMSNAAYNIMAAFDEAFRQIVTGSSRMTSALSSGSPYYRSILRESVRKSLDTEKSKASTDYNIAAEEYRNSSEYKQLQSEIRLLNALLSGLEKYQLGTWSWNTVLNEFSWLSEDLKKTLPESFAAIFDKNNPINFDTQEGLEQYFQTIGEDSAFDSFFEDIRLKLTDTISTLANLLESPEKASADNGGSSGKGKGLSFEKADLDAQAKTLEEIEDRYHEITREIERLGRILDKLGNLIDRTYGLDRLDLYKQELEELSTLAADLNSKLGRAVRYLRETDKPRLQTAFNKTLYDSLLASRLSSYGINLKDSLTINLKLDSKTNEIKDFEQLEQDILKDTANFMDAYHEFMVLYNNFVTTYEAASEEEKVNLNKKAEQWKLDYELLQKLFELVEALQEERIASITQYESTLDTINTLAHEYEDTMRRIEDAKLNEVSYRMEVILDVKDARQLIRAFTKEIAESFGDAITHGARTAELDWYQAKDEMSMYQEYVQEYNELKDLLDNANQYTDTEAIASELKNLEGHIIESGETLLEWTQKVEDMFVETLEAASERFSFFTNQLEHNDSILTSIKELYALLGLTYKTQLGFSRLLKVSQERLETLVTQAKLNRKWFEDTEALYQRAEAELNELIAREGANAELNVLYDMLKKNRDALLAEMQEALKQMLSYSQNALETAQLMALDVVDRLNYELEQRLTNGLGFDLLQDKYDHFIEEQDRYFDPVEESLETALWYTKLLADIDKASNKTYQDKLKALLEEIDLRRENNTLSQYDLDILEAKYKELQAYMELEDARNNKTLLRLVRDSQGNWNYQFTANDNDIAGKEQEFLNAQLNEYEITKNRVEQLSSDIIAAMSEAEEKSAEIQRAYINGELTREEAEKQLNELLQYYSKRIDFLRTELEIAETDMNAAAIKSTVLAANLSDAVYLTSDTAIKAIVDAFRNKHAPELLTQATTSLESLLMLLAENVSVFEDTSSDIQAAILGIIGAKEQDGPEAGSFSSLISNLETINPKIAEELNNWVASFSSSQISINDIVADLSNNFINELDKMTSGSSNFASSLESHLNQVENNFSDYEETVSSVADNTGTSLEKLDDMVHLVSESTDTMAEIGSYAVDSLNDLMWAAYDALSAYSDLALGVWDYINALKALALNLVVPTLTGISDVSTFDNNPITGDEYVRLNGDFSLRMMQTWANSLIARENGGNVGNYLELFNSLSEDRVKALMEKGGYSEEEARRLNDLLEAQIRTYTSVEEIMKVLQDTNQGLQNLGDIGAKINALYEDDYHTHEPTPFEEWLLGPYASGGYTGNFSGGRLGILHEKELILNETDTQKILNAVSAVRSLNDNIFSNIAHQLDNNGLTAMQLVGSRMRDIMPVQPPSADLQQSVTIENVAFPSVTSAREIEEAFENLVNDAAQWARRRKS